MKNPERSNGLRLAGGLGVEGCQGSHARVSMPGEYRFPKMEEGG